jgi:shikimate kinase
VLKKIDRPAGDGLAPSTAAWSLIALATFANIGRELELFAIPTQRKLMGEVGGRLAGLPQND